MGKNFDSDEEEEGKKNRKQVLFRMKGTDFLIKPYIINKVNKEHYLDSGGDPVYTISIYEFFGDQTVIPYADEHERDLEFENLVSKLQELDIDIR